MTFWHTINRLIAPLMGMLILSMPVGAVAPTEEAIAKWEAEGTWDAKVAQWRALRQAGLCAPEEHSLFNKEKRRFGLAAGQQIVDTANVIVILVDFSDNPSTIGISGTPQDFDSILFSDRRYPPPSNPSGSMTDFYLENSYGQFFVKGDIYGWYSMPHTYAYYVGTDDGLTYGRILAQDAVDAAYNGGADFSKYDYDSDGYCDGVVVIHAGRGAEEGVYGIWSHKWNLPSPGRFYNGVTISAYTMNPEEFGYNLSPIGVFCHEYGHFLGLPDFYDTDTTARSGLGYWSLMATGNYLGLSKTPCHLDAWCKAKAGFLTVTTLSSNTYQSTLPTIQYSPVVYKLANSTTGSSEYWLVENRQRYGFDRLLPGSGLCIYHVDELAPGGGNNEDYTRYHVALEQADGKNDLAALITNRGDGGDIWPGTTNKREFHNLTNPNTRTNVSSTVTKIGVWDISNADSIMSASFDVLYYSRPFIHLYGTDSLLFIDAPGGDGDGIMEAGETVQFFFTVKNEMRDSAYNVRAALSTTNPNVSFGINNVVLIDFLGTVARTNTLTPIEFTLSDSLTSVIDSFFLTITCDSLASPDGTNEFVMTAGFEAELGGPQVLIVDDDRGASYDTTYESVFHSLRIPSAVWEKQTQGSPTGAELGKFNIVIWFTGDSAANVLNASDIAAMKEYFDNGGNLLLSTYSGVLAIDDVDSLFLENYFHATHVANGKWFQYSGVPGNALGDGTAYRHKASPSPWYPMQLLQPAGGGQAAFRFSSDPTKICGTTYSGTYKSILLTFPAEFIDNAQVSLQHIDTLLARAIEFFGGIVTSVYDGQPFAQLPQNFDLFQNYPNPFNPVTNISYTLRATGGSGRVPERANVSVYNLLGEHVKTLVDEVQIPGTYTVSWDGTAGNGRRVASGIYFYRLQRGGDAQTRKMILLK
ncbi:MAG TPA: M6 family metalloprotease domain-containing protein [Candidatus Deferrimicrobium sp.]|nr:M6 family metalloprotease domain-containing protein [Candidatus Deferrimicrobium sp.]